MKNASDELFIVGIYLQTFLHDPYFMKIYQVSSARDNRDRA